jgi:hypothetical protein
MICVEGDDFGKWKIGPGINGNKSFLRLKVENTERSLYSLARDNYFDDDVVILLLPPEWEI